LAKTSETRKPSRPAPTKPLKGAKSASARPGGAGAKATTKSGAKPAAKAAPKAAAKAKPAPKGKPTPKPAPKPVQKPAAKASAKTASKPLAKPAAKSSAIKPIQKPAQKPPQKVNPVAAAKVAGKAPGSVGGKTPPKGTAGVPAKVTQPPKGGAPAKPGKTPPQKDVAKAPSKAPTAAELKAAAKAAVAAGKTLAKDAEPKGKGARGKAALNGAVDSALKPGEARLPPKKKGPIDLSTAKSVAAVAASTQADSSGYVLVNGRRVRMISTRGLPTPKRVKVVVEKVEEKPEPQIAAIKTKLTKKELDEYRALLLTKRRQLARMLSGMEDEALRSNGGNLSNMPLHMADIGTDTFDQDFTLGMAETERQLLDEIDAALGRIENKTYGVCQLTGKPIPKARLEAKPWAKYTVEAAKLIERGSPGR
jgi:RNA polymerase-binding protein DksA